MSSSSSSPSLSSFQNPTTTTSATSRSSCMLLLEQLSRNVGLQVKPSEIPFPNHDDKDQSSSSSSSSPPRNHNKRASVLVPLLLVERRPTTQPLQPQPPQSQETTTTTTTVTTTTSCSRRDDDDDQHQKEACCLHVILTQRSQHLSSHAGEVCLPGGRHEEGDKDDVTTALRETTEEIGIPSSQITPLCLLPPLPSKHGLSVTPVVGHWNLSSSLLEESNLSAVLQGHLTVSPGEVQAVFTVPLDYFWDHNGNLQSLVEVEGRAFPIRTYDYSHPDHRHPHPFKIWGLTAHILHRVAQLVYDEEEANTATPPEIEKLGGSGS